MASNFESHWSPALYNVHSQGSLVACNLQLEGYSQAMAVQPTQQPKFQSPQTMQQQGNQEADAADDEDSDDDGRNACDDLASLLSHLELLDRNGVRINEVTHIVNKWQLHGVVVPMKHHGVIFKTSTSQFLRAHLTRDGLAWKFYDERPAVPDNTCYSKVYACDGSLGALREYCEVTELWSWPRNDCETWAHGSMRAVGVREQLYKGKTSRALGPLRGWGRAPSGGAHAGPEPRGDEAAMPPMDQPKTGPALLGDLRAHSQAPAKSLLVKP